MKTNFANLQRYASENKKLLSNPNDGKRIVFFGDSITEFWTPKNSKIFHDKNIINRGISGQTTSQMVLRFQQDVIQLAPSTVVFLAGINDIAENTGPISIKDIFENCVTMLEEAAKHNINILLCSVLPCNFISWKSIIHPENKVMALNTMLENYAKITHITYVDYYSLLVDSNNGLDKKYSDDGVHPNFEGYQVMENSISKALILS